MEYLVLISLLSLSSIFLFIREKIRERKYSKFLKDIFKACVCYVNSNDACVYVKDENNKIVFSTKKTHFDFIDKIDGRKIEYIQVDGNNRITVNGEIYSPIDVIEKFCFMQEDEPQTGFVKIEEKIYFFLSKKLCLDKKYFYLYVYQPEEYLDMDKIFDALKHMKRISYAIFEKELIIFRGDEEINVIKSKIKLKC